MTTHALAQLSELALRYLELMQKERREQVVLHRFRAPLAVEDHERTPVLLPRSALALLAV